MRVVIFRWTAVSLGLALFACSDLGPSPLPYVMTMALGDNQAGKVGQRLDLPLMVRVTDHDHVGVANLPVKWSVAVGDGALQDLWERCSPLPDAEFGNPLPTASAKTSDDGLAWISFVPEWFGLTTVVAESHNIEGSPVMFTIDATDAGAAVTGIDSLGYPFDSTEVLEVVAAPGRTVDLEVSVTDGLGNGAPGVPVTWEITLGDGLFRGDFVGCSREDVNPTTIIARTSQATGYYQGYGGVSFQPTAFGITTVTATVAGVKGSSVTFTLDATLFEIDLGQTARDTTRFFGPDFTSDATVPIGARVEWLNENSTAHITSTAVPPGGASFDSGTLSKGERFQFVPGVAGTWEYVDQVSGATGRLTAEAP